jgi:hypothetical protein
VKVRIKIDSIQGNLKIVCFSIFVKPKLCPYLLSSRIRPITDELALVSPFNLSIQSK